MAPRLDIADRHRSFQIGWFDDGDDDLQGDFCLGEHGDPDTAKITAAVQAATPADYRHDAVLCWETRTDAKRALRVARAAHHFIISKRPLPNWAKIAISHGWTAPEGWVAE